MPGDVRGTFDLNDRPATAAMRRLKREGGELDVTLTKLGKTVDSIFSKKNVAEVVSYERALAKLDRQARTSFNSIGRNAREAEFQTTGAMRKMDASVTLFRENLDRLDKARATPTVDLDGITEALAQTALLEKRMAALSRRNATPNVSLPAPTFGGGGIAGGGGSSGFMRGGLRVPFAGAIPLPLVAAGLAAAPPLGGAAIATAGSLGSAALGAGALGIGAGGVGAAGIGMTAPIAISAISGIKEASKALDAYQKEVIQSGVNSEAARQKYRLLNMELRDAPAGTGRFLRSREALVDQFKGATRPAQAGFTGIGTRGINLGRQLTPLYAQQANRFFGEAQPQFDQFADFLNSGSSRQFYNAMGSEATASLGPTEDIAENVTDTLMNLSRASRPFFREGLRFLDRWTGGWRSSSDDIAGVRDDMRGWVGDLKTWGKLTGATFDLLKDLGSASSGSGSSLVGDLTEQLEVWDKWIEGNPRQVRSFFDESVESTERIAEAIGRVSHLIFEIGQMLTPILTQLSQFITFADQAGLLTPGMLPLLLAGGAGIRGVMGGARTRIAGGGAGMGAGEAMLMGGALGGGARGPGLMTRAGGFASRVGAMGRVPAMTTVGGRALTMGMEADAGMIGASRFSAGRAASYAGSEILGAGRGVAGTFLRGAGARFLPIAALMGGLQFASYPGTFGERTQAAASGLSAGFVPMPKTGEQEQDQGNQYASQVADYYARRYGSDDPAQLQEQIGAVRRKRHRLLRTEETTAGLTIGENIASIFGGVHGSEGPSDTDKAEAAALGQHLESLRGERVNRTTQTAMTDLVGAYEVRGRHMPGRQKGEGRDDYRDRAAAEEAANYKRTIGAIEGRVDRMKGRTKKQFAQMGLDWAEELAKANPKLKRAYDRMAEGIEERMRETGRRVAVINGNIVDVSAQSWDQVADQIGTATQRAYSEANENLTALEQRALTILRGMGYTRTEAQSLMHEAQTGRPTKAGSASNAEAHHHGKAGATANNMSKGSGRNASGGRLPMPASGSMHDDVYMGNGQWGAGNELVVNRHTESRVNRILRHAGTSLGREVAGENRAHSQAPREYNAALGGRLGGRYATGGILPAGQLATKMGLSVGEGPGYGGIPSSGHTGGSLHYSGLAYDVSGDPTLMRRYFYAAARAFRPSINELFYDPIGWYLDNGQKVPGAIGGHSDHVHIGFKSSDLQMGNRSINLSGGARGGAAGKRQEMHLQGPGSKMGGAPGAAVTAAGRMQAAGLSRNLNKLIGGRGAGGGGGGRLGGVGNLQRFNHSYPEMHLGGKGPKLSRSQTEAINEWAGIPPRLFYEISLGESGGYPGMTGVDPGGASEGLGLYMITTNVGNDELIAKYGGREAMLNPMINAKAAAEIYNGAGKSIQGWYGTSHVTKAGYSEVGKALGGRMKGAGFAGWFRDGGRGRVNGPTMIGLGEAGPEDFEITPTPKRGRAGRTGTVAPVVHVNLGGVTIASGQDAQRVGTQIGRAAAKELTKALAESDDVRDGELIGG